MKSLLIKDTTRKEREDVVRKSLEESGGICDDSNSCDSLVGATEVIYKDYIEGKMELKDINERYRCKNVQ